MSAVRSLRYRRRSRQRWLLRRLSLVITLLALALLLRLVVLHLPPPVLIDGLAWLIVGGMATVVLLTPPVTLLALILGLIQLRAGATARRPLRPAPPPRVHATAPVRVPEVVDGEIIDAEVIVHDPPCHDQTTPR